jgi:ABC-type multidrug transport system fused ATPase/permease subunit
MIEAVGKLKQLGADGEPPALSDILGNILVVFIDLAYYLFLITILITGIMYLFSSGEEEKLANIKKNFIYAITGFVMVAFAYSATALVASKTQALHITGDFNTAFVDITAGIFQLISMIAGAGFMVILLIGGFRYMTSAGMEETAAKAKQQMLQASIGLILTFSAFAIGTLIIKLIFSL